MARPRGVPDSGPKRDAERRELSDRFIKTVKPDPVLRLTFYDTKEPGLALRVYPSGVKSWKFVYRESGRPRWFTLAEFVDLATARKAVRQLKARRVLEPGFDPQAEKLGPRPAGTFEELVRLYLAEGAPERSRRQYEAQLANHALPRWGRWPAMDVTRDHVRALFREREKDAPASAAQLLAALSGCYRWAIAEGKLKIHPDANPAHGVTASKKNGQSTSRTRVLSAAELPLWWRALDELPRVLASALKLLLLTGQRSGEVRHLRWEHFEIGTHAFDFVTRDGRVREQRHPGAWWSLPGADDATWPGTKNHRDHRVWLTPAALELLGEPLARGYVFSGRRRDQPLEKLDRTMRRLSATLGLDPPVTGHDLRRTHGSTVTSLGFTRDVMNRIQNHLEGGIGSVYDQHEYADEARRVQEAVSQRLLGLVRGAETKVLELAGRRQ